MQIRLITPEATLPIRHRVLWPSKPIEFCQVKEDDSGIHFGVFEDDSLLCVASVFITGAEARLRKFATLHEHQGRGMGTGMIEHIIEYLKQQGVTCFWCDARESAQEFYARFNMQKHGERFFKSGEPYFRMSVELKH
ncbi:GNAT family N-acetyltransferase [Vibrio breoganii]|uniref:GNAT family N-acetyltransferase n=1 Tax=Vibrio breoganii TaxID=553239 RepID=UPI000C863862|nr:GNAT family N-acetyltransferase [Vibrio breoganii]PMP07204.1 GNAT family N-acetyltransferase [Vibrio breoganii]